MKKKLIIAIIIVLVVLFIVACGYLFFKGLEDDKEKTALKAKEVNGDYTKFNENILSFSKQRENLYKNLENTYLEEFSKSYNDWNTLIDNYEKTILKIEDSSKNLKENCLYRFSDVLANSNCTNFKANYEAAMNYYITDVKNYNKRVLKYNAWVTDGGYNYGKLNSARLVVYKKYIDFDEDGEYFGKGDK